jgi:hypothetical protein
MRPRATLAPLCALLLLGCRQEAPTTTEPPPLPALASAEEASPRDAFGLPLPPRIKELRRYDDQITVDTDMTLRQLELFFKPRATDYEVLMVNGTLQIIGLREGMARASASYVAGTMSHIRIYYNAPRELGEVNAPPEGTPAPDPTKPAAAQARSTRRAPYKPPVRGEAVDLRTDDGRLLAPGAKWGEPYYPPKGTPLHDETHRSNWGRPFGEWLSY